MTFMPFIYPRLHARSLGRDVLPPPILRRNGFDVRCRMAVVLQTRARNSTTVV